MRQKNMRLIVVGLILIVAAAAFFLFMMSLAPKSNDPVAMMSTVGEAAGVVSVIGLVMAVFGLIGKRR